MSEKTIAIVGGGPAGLFCAYKLIEKGHRVDLYDHSTGLAKKFLIAGNGGLNLTHSEPLEDFSKKYGPNEVYFKELLSEFSPEDLRNWCSEIDVETFVGSSGRVFPTKLKAGDILLKWTKILKEHQKFSLYLKHSLRHIAKDKTLTFDNEGSIVSAHYETIILALGGASWKKTGSDGKWPSFLDQLEINIMPFKPMNCGFEMNWSEYLQKNLERIPLKNIMLDLDGHKVRGEVMLTPYGIEGGAIYAISNRIRDAIQKYKECKVLLDLKPDLMTSKLQEILGEKPSKKSLASFLASTLNIPKGMYAVLIDILDKDQFNDTDYLASYLKALPLRLVNPRPIDEAISTGGGITFDSLTPNLESKNHPGIYVVGEMLDFEAPTGGYLLQGCFSTAYRVINSL